MFDIINSIITRYILFLRPQDFIDIIIVAYIVYKGLQLIRETRAEQLVKGIIFLLLALQISDWFKLYTINYILRNTMQIGVLAIVVLFQPELRRGLEQVGRSNIGRIFIGDDNSEYNPENVAVQICSAVKQLSEKRIGALIVLERRTKIGDIIRTGVVMNSAVSAELIVNIFTPNTPLHDGAVVIRNNQIMAAACLLPLTPNQNLSFELGTRHRAALGLSETSDGAVVVVSEETGKISIALGGALTRNLTLDSLQKALDKILLPDENPRPVKSILSRKGQGK